MILGHAGGRCGADEGALLPSGEAGGGAPSGVDVRQRLAAPLRPLDLDTAGEDLVLDAERAHQLHGASAHAGGAGQRRELRTALHKQEVDAVAAERGRRGEAARAGAHDQHGGVALRGHGIKACRSVLWDTYGLLALRGVVTTKPARLFTLRSMGQAELLIAGLLVAVAGLSALARYVSIPYPIVLVIGGAVFGLIPGVPEVKLNPDVVLVVFLPPLLYGAAFFANFGDMRANLRSLSLSSIGLVLVTMTLVAVAAHHLIDGMSWAAAFSLGAIVSPTDPLAGGSIMRRLGLPRRIVSMVEGEGLFNDATALVAYKVAVAAVIGASFSLANASLKFVVGAAGGVAIGLAVGWAIAEVRRRITDTQVSITISLMSGYAAFIPADKAGVSGVVAAVTTGIYMGFRGPSIISPRTRLQGFFVWEI